MIPREPLTITGGQLLTGSGVAAAGSIRCEGDRIVAVGEVEVKAGDRTHDASGKIVMPGIIDLGVFEIDKPAFHFGGITRAALMPDQNPPLDYPARVRFAASYGKPDFWVHPIAAATRGLAGSELPELGLMQEAGCLLYTSPSPRDRG